jgi:predicted RNA binding protein YcfA (HicA-like mRNA interferase family)
MGRRRKHFDRIVNGGSDANIPFEQVRNLLLHLGFEERIQGSHHVFKRAEIPERINLQPEKGGDCKAYQVRQLREVLRRYNLGEEQ